MHDRCFRARLTTQIAALLALFLALFVTSYWRTKAAIDARQCDGFVINRMGLQRMLVQQYAAHIHRVTVGLAVGDWESVLEYKRRAALIAASFEQGQEAFLNGGELDISVGDFERKSIDGETGIVIPPISDKATRDALARANEAWADLHRSAVTALRSDRWGLKGNVYVDRLLSDADATVWHVNNAAHWMETASREKLSWLNSLQQGFLIAAACLFILTLAFVHRGIVVPLANSFSEREQLKKAAERLALVAKYTDNAVAITNRGGGIEWVNEGFTRMTGYSLDEVRGQLPIVTLQGEETCPDTATRIRASYAAGNGCDAEVVGYSKSGDKLWLAVEMRPIRDSDGEPVNFVVIQSDITARKEAEAALDAAMRRANSANQAKGEFLANMSHEIRTPLTAILGYAEMLVEDGDIRKAPKRRIDALQTVRHNGDHLLAIINSILDLSKIEAGKLNVECVEFEPVDLIDDVVDLMRVRAESKGLHLESTLDTDVPKYIKSDPTRVRQILINLVGNAIKFTETGAVRIVSRFVAGDPSHLEFDIVDTGIGMTLEQQSGLFQPFAQADNSTTRRFGGTGLGLALSKRLATMLGGDLTIVDSRPGEGSRFRLSIKVGRVAGIPFISQVQAASGGARPPIDSDSFPTTGLDGLKLLVAEDGPDNQRLLDFILRKAGADVSIVENGQLAVEAATSASDAGEPFDVVLMDMQMPVLDGYSATAQLREREYDGAILALTANAMSGDEKKCLAAGCDDYAAKPIDRAKLLTQLLTLATRRRDAVVNG